GIETETGKFTDLADLTTLILGWQRVGGVLYDPEIVKPREAMKLLHIARLAAQVNGNDGLAAAGDSAGRVFGIDIHGQRIDVHEHRPRARVNDSFRGRREGGGRKENFIARADSRGL